jgi:hypothetical protein
VRPILELFLIFRSAHVVVALYLCDEIGNCFEHLGISSQPLVSGMPDEKSVIGSLRFGDEVFEKVKLRSDESHGWLFLDGWLWLVLLESLYRHFTPETLTQGGDVGSCLVGFIV